MSEPFRGEARLADIQVNPDHWGDGAEPIVKAWLRHNYDPDTMPTLQVAQIVDREGIWLLGWDITGTEYPPLLELIFGEEYAREQLARIDADREIPGGSFGQGRL